MSKSTDSPRLSPALAGLLALILPLPARAVTISEIHYHPKQGSQLEFLELQNAAPRAVPIDGWKFDKGIDFTFPAGAEIPAEGYVVVARDPIALAQKYGLDLDSGLVFGPYASNLKNGGEEVVLLDSLGSLVDAVEYDDFPPWDPSADGKGGSLERICPGADPDLPSSWRSDPQGPTPLAPPRFAEECPPPPLPAPRVAINEINYHPKGDKDAAEEFVELLNTTGAAIDLGGWRFFQGLDFIFPAGSAIGPGETLVVARNLAKGSETLGFEGAAVGDFQGDLDNGGARLTLVDGEGAIVDSVRYRDSGDWPVAADGLGRSLERVSPLAPSDDPANWMPSRGSALDRWHTFTKTGVATSSILLLYDGGIGEYLIDDLVLVALSDPETNLLHNGSFDAGIDGWTAAGNHATSAWEANGQSSGNGALHLIATGKGTGATNGIGLAIDPPLTTNAAYRLTLKYRFLSGDASLLVRLNGASLSRGIFLDTRTLPLATPGSPNSVASSEVPPFVSHLRRVPREPTSKDPVTLTARVRGEEVAGVYLTYLLNFKAQPAETVEMLDDGLHGDGEAGDGIYGVTLPPQPHNTPVTFRIEAERKSGANRFHPDDGDPMISRGYYVNDDQPASPLPVYQVLFNHLSSANNMTLARALTCGNYVPAAFAFHGELTPNCFLRRRGGSVCSSAKPFLLLKFPHGHDFQSQHKINFQSLWTDKSLVREHLSWDFFESLEQPVQHTPFVRMHVNGKYYGLHTALEHPDSGWLKRNALDPNGNLYKAVASTDKLADYPSGFSKKTNQNDPDTTDLKAFLTAMNNTAKPKMEEFWLKSTVPDNIIDYQAVQTLTNNSDYPHKNHYLFHDLASDRWWVIGWDMDLTFGKIWDGTFGGVEHDKMQNPGNTPWYTTRVDGGGLGNSLMDRFFYDTPDKFFQRAYLVRLWIAIQEKYTSELLAVKLQSLVDLLLSEQADDLKKWNRSPATADDPRAPKEFLPNIDRVKEHVRLRRAYLLNYLKTTSKLATPDRLKITEVMYHPVDKDQALEFIELWNNSGKEIDISGWTLEGVEYQFPPGTTVPADQAFVLARDPDRFRDNYGDVARLFGPYPGDLDDTGETLRLRDAGPGYPATIDVLRYSSEPPWPRLANELGHSLELTEVSADRDNDPPENWRDSAFPRGTPGTIPGLIRGIPFRRGSCNGDDHVNVSDAIYILGLLTEGFPPPSCLDGCDANGDRVLDLSDAVVILRYLFLNENQIADPGPRACGAVQGAYCEVSNCKTGG